MSFDIRNNKEHQNTPQHTADAASLLKDVPSFPLIPFTTDTGGHNHNIGEVQIKYQKLCLYDTTHI